MRNLRGTYVHRGDGLRRRRRLVRALYAVGFIVACAFLVTHRKPEPTAAMAAEVHHSSHFFGLGGESDRLRSQLETTRGDLNLARAQLDRANRILAFSTKYKVTGDLATTIFDTALEEGIDPDLAFRLVRLESDFNDHAVSPKGAIGLTQIMPATARYFQKGITRDGLYDRKANLHCGLRYLRALVTEYHGNVNLALLVYNRGEVAVKDALAAGENPTNGYDRKVMRGYKGSGVVD